MRDSISNYGNVDRVRIYQTWRQGCELEEIRVNNEPLRMEKQVNTIVQFLYPEKPVSGLLSKYWYFLGEQWSNNYSSVGEEGKKQANKKTEKEKCYSFTCIRIFVLVRFSLICFCFFVFLLLSFSCILRFVCICYTKYRVVASILIWISQNFSAFAFDKWSLFYF